MIPYSKSFIGLKLIFRINGSPLYRAAIPALISVVVYTLLGKYVEGDDNKYVAHPYGVGVLVSSVSFLIVFRANYGYQRYWKACGDVHRFMSKWLDAVTHTGVFHMQQKHYDHIKPHSYFDHHNLNNLSLRRDRNRYKDSMKRPLLQPISMIQSHKMEEKLISQVHFPIVANNSTGEFYHDFFSKGSNSVIQDDPYLIGEGRKDGGWGAMFNDAKSTYYDVNKSQTWQSNKKGFASTAGGRTPNLFLQELTHLASLLVAVAFSTLRDVEGSEAPLDFYKAGEPWPEVDPDRIDKNAGKPLNSIVDTIRYLSGVDRTPAMRTAHNASRPLLVIGGVSENEIAFLQRAKGPSAKVNLAWHWLSEFIMREHLAGSLGAIGPAIVSRLIQFLSDGMIYYNHARKTMFIPFPFPHAQISAFFVFIIMFAVPILMHDYANNVFLGSILTFLTVTALAGLHEVARELENPFRNVPNEIPLNTLLAMFNESLITNFAGFHPDHYWDPDEYRKNDLVSPQSVVSPGMNEPSEKGHIEKPQVLSESEINKLKQLVTKQEEELKRLKNLIQNVDFSAQENTKIVEKMEIFQGSKINGCPEVEGEAFCIGNDDSTTKENVMTDEETEVIQNSKMNEVAFVETDDITTQENITAYVKK